MKNKFAVIIIAAFALAAVAYLITGESPPTNKVEIPPAPTENIYVADYAAMLDESTKEKILATGKALRAKHKAQVVVVTIETLGDWNIEEYAHTLFRNWGIGDKNSNNGVLLLISKNDKKFRIEVGYGLEGAITDGYAGSVLDSMKSYFRKENYSAGTLQAYNELTKKIYEEYGGEIPENLETAPENSAEDFTTGEIIVLVIFILIIIISIFGRGGGGGGFFPFWIDTGSSDRSYGGGRNSDDDDFGGGDSGGGGASDGW